MEIIIPIHQIEGGVAIKKGNRDIKKYTRHRIGLGPTFWCSSVLVNAREGHVGVLDPEFSSYVPRLPSLLVSFMNYVWCCTLQFTTDGIF
jgi:hypothetical protein